MKTKQTTNWRSAASTLMFTLVTMPMLSLAQPKGGGGDFAGTKSTTEKFFTNINGILNVASISVVTIAIVFAGYQIAFAHKRISDVAPILIGGFLIGAAAQVANMLIGTS